MSKGSDTAWKIAALGAAAFWVFQGVKWVRGMRRLPRLHPLPESERSFPHRFYHMHEDVRLAIIVPACNEEHTVGAAMDSLLAHAPHNALVVAVDDRSTDATGAVLDRLSATDRRLHVLHVTDLPFGWLGKTHALWAGTRRARRLWGGEADLSDAWFLFTDADVLYADGGIPAALRHARRRGLDHLTLYPGLDVRGFWETTFTSAFMFLFGLAFRIWQVNDPRSDAYVGIGAFNLVRASAYERIGGHRALALEVADDVALGQAIRRAGGRQEAALGQDILRVRWQHSLWGLITGLEKNGFAGINYSLPRLVGATVGLGLLNVPFAAAWTKGRAGRFASLAALFMVARIYRQAQRHGGPSWWYFLTFPLGTALFLVSLWRSAVLALWRGGIVWRDTFYPLALLKAKPIPDGAGCWVLGSGILRTSTQDPAPSTQEMQ